MHERENALKEWLAAIISEKNYELKPLTGDASFRRYYRLHISGNSLIVMDAPPDKEALEPFIYIAQLLKKAQIPRPEILEINLKEGFLLLSDLGDHLLLGQLNENTVDHFCKEALNLIFQMQQGSIKDAQLPAFDSHFMLQEMSLCTQWFLKAYLQLDMSPDELQLLSKNMAWIAAEVARQPLTFIHRDYHSRNLMLVPHENKQVLAVIDFQDAMKGPISYDVVSLLKDCYISWPREKILGWLTYYYEMQPLINQKTSLDAFIRAVDLCGLQRHLKVLGVFSRLYLRDGKSGYLADLPLVLNYVLECCELYKELHPLLDYLQTRVHLP